MLFIVDFVEVLDHDLVDYLTLLQLLQETHLWTWEFDNGEGGDSSFRLVPFTVDLEEVLDPVDELKDPTTTLMN